MDGKFLGRVVALLIGMAFVLAPSLVATVHAADDPYTAGVATRCTVDVPTQVERDGKATIRLDVRANAPSDAEPPRGTIRLRVVRDGEQVWARQLPFRGRAVQVDTPRLRQPGRHEVTSQFSPRQGSVYRDCSGQATFRVSNGVSPNVDGPDGNDNGTGPQGIGPQGGDLGGTEGLLPDTGGPNSAWLVLALLLVGGGGGLVVAARGRREPDYEF